MLMNLKIHICILSFVCAFKAGQGFVTGINFATIQDRYDDFLVGNIEQQSSSPPPPTPLPKPLSFDLSFLATDQDDQLQPGQFEKFETSQASLNNINAVYGAAFSEQQKESILSQQTDDDFKDAVLETIKLLGS
eukprot:TRINITY_DN5660_c0_g1_i2.p4 TRINITY_DN5660_c0_g1~~TRINITY_DN5660_c0_g1_i2.p4  ORF type:complete len:134 (+),score=19.26 TRINITY_DN5660_c0_g1_i2:259-660(+)